MGTRRLSLDVTEDALERLHDVKERFEKQMGRPSSLRDVVQSGLGLLYLVLDAVENGGEVVVRRGEQEKVLTFL